MGWRDYEQLTAIQQRDFQIVNPQLGPDWKRFQAWVKRDGGVSRGKGHWKWTAAYSSGVDRVIVGAVHAVIAQETPPTRDSPVKFQSCVFHFAPEK